MPKVNGSSRRQQVDSSFLCLAIFRLFREAARVSAGSGRWKMCRKNRNLRGPLKTNQETPRFDESNEKARGQTVREWSVARPCWGLGGGLTSFPLLIQSTTWLGYTCVLLDREPCGSCRFQFHPKIGGRTFQTTGKLLFFFVSFYSSAAASDENDTKHSTHTHGQNGQVKMTQFHHH